MKNIFVLLLILALFFNSCIQKSYEQTVTLELDVSGIKNIKTVGVRGEHKPLSWDEDLIMRPIVKDSLYTVQITGKTGYLFEEVKFVVNGEFELQNKPNRRIIFDNTKKTIYKAKFNQN